MATPATLDRTALVAIAVVHLAVQAAHAYSHIVADVPNTALQQVFIVLVVTIGPLAAALIALRWSLRLGAALLAASMVASFAFGYLLHFVFDTPDLHTNVVGDHSGIFFHSALNLAMVELVGFVYGLTVALRGRA